MQKIKSIMYYIGLNWAAFPAVTCYILFFVFADLLFTKYFFVEILLFAAGIFFTYIQFKINPDLLTNVTECKQPDVEKAVNRSAAVLDWNITYEWAVLLGKDKE